MSRPELFYSFVVFLGGGRFYNFVWSVNDKRELSFKNGLNFLVFQFFYQKFFYFFSFFLEGGRFCNILWSANDKRGLSFENGPIMTGRTMKTVIWWSFPNQLLLFYGRRSTMGWIFLWRRIILFFFIYFDSYSRDFSVQFFTQLFTKV